MKLNLGLLVATLFTVFGASAFSASESYFCCIQSSLDNENGIDHKNQSKYCVNNNSEELTETKANVFSIAKYGYTFQVDLNEVRSKSIMISKPDGTVQTGPERELMKGLVWDLSIGTFGDPQYQYASDTAGGFNLDCGKK